MKNFTVLMTPPIFCLFLGNRRKVTLTMGALVIVCTYHFVKDARSSFFSYKFDKAAAREGVSLK